MAGYGNEHQRHSPSPSHAWVAARSSYSAPFRSLNLCSMSHFVILHLFFLSAPGFLLGKGPFSFFESESASAKPAFGAVRWLRGAHRPVAPSEPRLPLPGGCINLGGGRSGGARMVPFSSLVGRQLAEKPFENPDRLRLEALIIIKKLEFLVPYIGT